jgi:hypothetical protein
VEEHHIPVLVVVALRIPFQEEADGIEVVVMIFPFLLVLVEVEVLLCLPLILLLFLLLLLRRPRLPWCDLVYPKTFLFEVLDHSPGLH